MRYLGPMTDDTAPSRFTPLDIETGSADDLYRLPPGSGYVRLTGVGDTAEQGSRPVKPRTPYVTVNGHLFDFPALDRHCGIPVEQTIPFSRDLRVAAFQHDPPTTYQTKSGPGFKSYSMDALGERYLQQPKSDLGKALAKEYGGWDHIPADDPRYAEYLRADLDLTRRLNDVIPYDPYEQREAWVATVTARMTLTGFRADVAGLQARVASLDARAAAGRQMLAESFGFPLTNKAGKPAAAPQRTKAGKEAFEAALTSFGVDVTNWPRGSDGTLSIGKDVMEKAFEWATSTLHPSLPVIEAVQQMNGIRNSAANVLRHVTGGRAHYTFEPFQSTGRWSNGLSVIKKSTEDSERAYLLPEEGHVLGSIDLDQIDIRGAAAHSQDPALIALLNDPDRDIHTEIAAMSGVDRKPAKTLDLGWLYGRGARGMAENTPGVTMEAALAVTRYMSGAFPGVVRWQQDVRERGSAGLLIGNGFGRNLRTDPDRAYTQAPALVGQSTTRDLIAEGLLDIARRAPEILPLLRATVHDELVFSAPEADFEEVARTVQSCMSRQWAPAGCSIPVNISAGQGKPFARGATWAALYL